jgi:Asp-tRNA(Asn)/Glu-tRNA(Gln) amidotransferase A subunit family amidase
MPLTTDPCEEAVCQALEQELASSRRRFLGLAAAAAGVGLVPRALGAGPPVTLPETDDPGVITAADIKAAEKVMSVSYSDEQRQAVLETMDSMQRSVRAVREMDLGNAPPPAGFFDPRLPGKSYPSPANAVKPAARPLPGLPGNTGDIAFANLVDLGHWIRTRQLSAVDLTGIYLERIARFGPQLECFITVTAELAREQARKADEDLARGRWRGPLHGIPYALKDLADTRGIKTTWGAEPFRERVPDEDARLVTLLEEAGAVLVGKAVSGALAYGDIWFGGKTRNPWNREEGSAGSSAGPASAVAAGLAGFAIGTETMGSIISPSNRCGVAGLRPTFGRVPRAGFMTLAWSLDKVGPICRFAEDTAIVLSVINRFDAGDGYSSDVGFNYDGGQDLAAVRVGFSPDALHGERVTQADFEALQAARDLGLNLVQVDIPDLPADALKSIIRAEAGAAFESFEFSGALDMLKYKGRFARARQNRVTRFLSAIDYINMQRARLVVMREFDRLFDDIDVLIAPSYAKNLLTVSNYAGTPQLVFRAGFIETPARNISGRVIDSAAPAHRVPAGFSVFGPLYGEGPMVRVANALEAKLGSVALRPPL